MSDTMSKKQFIISGIGTDVGKTVASAIISQALGIIILLLNAFEFLDDKKTIIFGKTLLIVFTLLATYYYHNIFVVLKLTH